MNIEIERFFFGFVRSFHLLNIPIEKDFRNKSLFTHEVISYWSRVGSTLGYMPWCEEEGGKLDKRKRDLGWYNIESQEYVFHLETENNPSKIEDTIMKLINSSEELKIGVIFAKASDNVEDLAKKLEKIKTGNTLIITTWWGEKKAEGTEEEIRYRVTGHIIKSGNVRLIEKEAFLVWSKYGHTLKMIFKDNANW